MKRCRSALLAALLASIAMLAQGAGLHRFTVAGEPPLQALLWTPCAQPPALLKRGPFEVMATEDCPVAASGKLPWVVISHGYGGSALSHWNMAAALADGGIAVLSLNHSLDSALNLAQGGSFAALEARPADVRRAIDGVLADSRWRAVLDAQRIGFLGFSRGAYTGLVLAGARPDFAQLAGHCPEPPSPLCQAIAQGQIPALKPQPEPRIKAMVLADPLAAFGASSGLEKLKLPLQLWASEQGGDGVPAGSVQALAALLPAGKADKPPLHVVAGAAHFAFLAPCSAQLAAAAPQICSDPAGFDRRAFQPRWAAEVLAFFRQKL
ncbi:alpha/beta hydrolase family protein [Comamonas koreensis]|uniref:alpha/beta hydrolase family protein n=1 Tax=Comamonas koreensis TaxID=160825 RepID=UPI0015FA5FA4|nr:dienelactone hydrolase [Comamonas koreensis]